MYKRQTKTGSSIAAQNHWPMATGVAKCANAKTFILSGKITSGGTLASPLNRFISDLEYGKYGTYLIEGYVCVCTVIYGKVRIYRTLSDLPLISPA